MSNRRDFLIKSSALAAGTIIFPSWINFEASEKVKNIGVQLYTFRKAMSEDAAGTLKKIAALGYKEIETARSSKGHYYGLGAKGMKNICNDLGMTLRSGHVHLDKNWYKTLNEAVESGQEYVIVSSMPSKGQSVSNYSAVAEKFNKAGEAAKELNLKFGYHNHAYEFESDHGKVLFDVLLDNTQADLVHMELDLGWVIMGGKNPLDYFKKYPGRFPLWHLKDMNLKEKHSTEFGKGSLDILSMFQHSKESGLKYAFVEQEEYTSSPMQSMKENIEYLNQLKY